MGVAYISITRIEKMTEYLRDLLFPPELSNKSLGDVVALLKPFMIVAQVVAPPSVVVALPSAVIQEVVVPAVASTVVNTDKASVSGSLVANALVTGSSVAVASVAVASVTGSSVAYTKPSKISSASTKLDPGLSSIFWCAYTTSHGGTELNLPLVMIPREERRIREDCISRVSPAHVKQKFPFLTLSQIQGLLQEIQMYQQTRNRESESLATWYIWATYYADTMPSLTIIYDRVYIQLPGLLTNRITIVYDRNAQKYRIASVQEETLYPIVNLLKPINGVGSYKLPDLETFALQLGLVEDDEVIGKKKGELYARVCESIARMLKI